jgi:hypothetical protein
MDDKQREQFAAALRARLRAQRQAEEEAARRPPPEPTIADLLKPPSVREAKKRQPKKKARGRNAWIAAANLARQIIHGHESTEARLEARRLMKPSGLSEAEIETLIEEAPLEEASGLTTLGPSGSRGRKART